MEAASYRPRSVTLGCGAVGAGADSDAGGLGGDGGVGGDVGGAAGFAVERRQIDQEVLGRVVAEVDGPVDRVDQQAFGIGRVVGPEQDVDERLGRAAPRPPVEMVGVHGPIHQGGGFFEAFVAPGVVAHELTDLRQVGVALDRLAVFARGGVGGDEPLQRPGAGLHFVGRQPRFDQELEKPAGRVAFRRGGGGFGLGQDVLALAELGPQLDVEAPEGVGGPRLDHLLDEVEERSLGPGAGEGLGDAVGETDFLLGVGVVSVHQGGGVVDAVVDDQAHQVHRPGVL